MKLITLEDLAPYMGEEIDESPHIRPASSYVDEVMDIFCNPQSHQGSVLPWGKYEHDLQFRPQEVTMWVGITSHGKSILTGQVFTSFMAQGDRCGMLSFEMKPRTTLVRMCRQASLGAEPSPRFIKEFHNWTNDKLWLYDQSGTVKTQRVIACCRYMAKVLRINHIIIDSLMKCGLKEDDFNGQKMFVDELCALARDYGTHIHLVNHSKKLHENNQTPGIFDSKGSGTVADQVDNVFVIWRNKKKEAQAISGKHDESEPDALLIVEKNRNGEGNPRICLWFHPKSQQFVSSPKAAPIDLMDRSF
jgi:twinkle protein